MVLTFFILLDYDVSKKQEHTQRTQRAKRTKNSRLARRKMEDIMSEIVLKTNSLTKKYSGRAAVDNVNITIKKGDIYGLIGRNGAGKTTLIRLITSLSRPDSGDITLFGQSTPAGLTEGRKRLGCVVETPALYPNLSAVQNLEYYRILRGIPEKHIVTEALQMVGLADVGKKRFDKFSLGMKQRLGLALAIMSHPDFIILDEPINGLDPIGIIEMRETLKKLNTEYGITILLSSHILTELSQLATCYGIINDGKMIKQFSQQELKENCQKSLSIQTDDVSQSAQAIETVLKTNRYKIISQSEIRLYDYLDDSAEVIYQLSNAGIRIKSMNEIGDNLEDYFKSILDEDSQGRGI